MIYSITTFYYCSCTFSELSCPIFKDERSLCNFHVYSPTKASNFFLRLSHLSIPLIYNKLVLLQKTSHFRLYGLFCLFDLPGNENLAYCIDFQFTPHKVNIQPKYLISIYYLSLKGRKLGFPMIGNFI